MGESIPSAKDAVRTSFDSLAGLDKGGWSHNQHYHAFLLKHLPNRMEAALDIGCGTGDFARVLAVRAERVLAVDFSIEMIRRSQARSEAFANITYVTADIADYLLPANTFDGIVSIATFHHLQFASMLSKIAVALKPGGCLVILDLYRPEGVFDHLMSLCAVPAAFILRLLNTGRLGDSPEARALWREHSALDHLETLSTIRAVSHAVIPDARIRRHLLWRYSLVWRKPCQ